MGPVVILDTNSLYGRKPLRRANDLLLLAMSRSGQVRLVIPDIVIHELSRQWVERVEESAAASNAALKKLNEALEDVGSVLVEVAIPQVEKAIFYDYAKLALGAKGADMPLPPEVSVATLLTKDMNLQKPFDRSGKGFRDALIWETIRVVCNELADPSVPVLFVTDNHTDFCVSKGGPLHPDLASDLPMGLTFEVVPSIYQLLKRDDLAQFIALAETISTHHELEELFTTARLEELIDVPISELHGRGVEDAVGVYVGSGMFEVAVNTGLEGADFDEILPDLDSLDAKMFHDGDDFTLRVAFEADCSFTGFVDRYMPDDDSVTFLESWNDHVVRASVLGRVRFVLSGSFTTATVKDLVLSLDEAEDA